MNNIEVLDCTLRDGGYINNWEFGISNIEYIINELTSANIEYIECGFINNINSEYDLNQSLFKTFNDAEKLIKNPCKSKFAVMMLIDEYDINKLPIYSNGLVNIIRLSFHKCDLNKAIDYAIKIKEKGYELFFQPTVIMSYTENEIIDLLNLCNTTIKPDGVGMVDTLGEMKLHDIKRLTKLFDKYLDKTIKLGFHGHNNLQLAFGNAITFIENVDKDRSVVIDTSVMGMGRDAGNVCTELMSSYLNNYYDKNYNFEKILQIINDVILNFRKKFEWGYTPAFMLNANNRIHPNYGKLFRNQIKNINLMEMNYLLNKIPLHERDEFNKETAISLLGEFIKK